LAASKFIPLLSTAFAVSYIEQDSTRWEEMLTAAGNRAGAVAVSSYDNLQNHWDKILRCSCVSV